MLANDFHIMDKKILQDIEKENHNGNFLVCYIP